MQFSQQTLMDCQIISSSTAIPSVVQLFNYTETEGGLVKLEEILSTKPDSISQVLERQATLQFIAASGDLCQLRLNRYDVRYITEYLHSNLGQLNDGLLINLNMKLNLSGVKQEVSYVKSGLKLIQRFLNLILPVAKRFQALAPTVLQKKAESLSLLIEASTFERIQKENLDSASANTISKLDHQFRFQAKDEFEKILNEVYGLDALFSLGKSVRELGLTFPGITGSGKVLQIDSARNLFIPGAVTTSFKFEEGKRLVFLSGPNMAGKSSFLRTTGLIICLAHIGMAVPAQHASIPFFDLVEIQINSNDNPKEGYSQFYSEIIKIRSLLNDIDSGKNCFFVFDEIFKGTNLTDATACAEILFERLHTNQNSTGIVSSHHTDLLSNVDDEPLQFMFLDVMLEDEKPIFTYQLKQGISQIKLGLYLFKELGI